MAITRTAWIDDDGSGTTGTVINNAEKTLLYDQIDAALGTTASKYDTVPATLTNTGTVHNWAVGLAGHTLTRWAGAADLVVTGVAGGVAGQRWTFRNLGSFVAYFGHNNGSSLFQNRVWNTATSNATPVAPGGQVTYEHDGSAWLLVAHEQGNWITPPYAAGNFTPNAGTWGVDAGDIATYAARLSGRSLTVSWYLQATAVSGAPSALRVKIPGGFTAAAASLHSVVHDDNGGGNAGSFALVTGAGATTIDTYKSYGAGSFATSSPGATRLFGTVTIEVT